MTGQTRLTARTGRDAMGRDATGRTECMGWSTRTRTDWTDGTVQTGQDEREGRDASGRDGTGQDWTYVRFRTSYTQIEYALHRFVIRCALTFSSYQISGSITIETLRYKTIYSMRGPRLYCQISSGIACNVKMSDFLFGPPLAGLNF